jgi:hypothetical protein
VWGDTLRSTSGLIRAQHTIRDTGGIGNLKKLIVTPWRLYQNLGRSLGSAGPVLPACRRSGTLAQQLLAIENAAGCYARRGRSNSLHTAKREAACSEPLRPVPTLTVLGVIGSWGGGNGRPRAR